MNERRERSPFAFGLSRPPEVLHDDLLVQAGYILGVSERNKGCKMHDFNRKLPPLVVEAGRDPLKKWQNFQDIC